MSGVSRIPLRFTRIKDMDKKIKNKKMAKQVKSTTTPSAWVVNSKDRGRKSIKKGKVYLQDKEEFQIELFNPLQDCVLADIKLNGNSISKSGLVLNPGQRYYLDCFIDDKKKFVFNTYEVEDTDEVKQAISKNGLLEVFFYKESVVTLDNWSNKFDKVIIQKYYPSWYPYYPSYPWGGVYCGGTIGISGTTFTTTGSLATSNSIVGTTTNTMNTGYCNTGSVDLSNLKVSNNAYYSSNLTNVSNSTFTSYSSNIETGRVEKGNKSKQKFDSVNMDFEKYYIASTILTLLPESRKPAEIKGVKLNIELPKGDWTKEQLEEIKGVVNQYVWKEDSKEIRKDMDNNIELIKKLSDLHNSGILTDEEFSSKKAELLSKI
jgi:hypothetical protein